MAAPTRRRIRWRTKHYFSVAMVGALVAIALVAAISICLAPAHLSFSITNANLVIYGPLAIHSYNTHLNFTLMAINSSPRTAVWYGPLTGEISYGPTAALAWVPCGNPGLPPDVWMEPRSHFDFSFSANYSYNENTEYALDNGQITMVSKVRFSWLGLSTRPYTVRFSCEHVNFKEVTSSFPIICA